MESLGNEPMEMVALGRSFDLGMFYDCRRDKLVPGITLWDKEKLDRDMKVTHKPNTFSKIVASESISAKSSSLGVDASLKASFLSGLVEVEGSAKYLNDSKTSTKQARVTLQYKTTTVFKALTMDLLGTANLKHCEVIEKDLATHVVTGILYGAQAFFVFDQETFGDENVQDIQGNLKVMIEKIPKCRIDGSGDLKMGSTDREKVNKFSCTFYGDFHLEKNPTTFEESVKVFQDLPKLLGPDGAKAVPVTVHLLPLSALDSRASKLVRQISLRLVTEAENILENFTELEMWCSDVLNSSTGQNFSQISEKIQTFKALCSEFKLGLQGTLAQKLPSIRGGGEEESVLAEVLKKAAESPFKSYKLKQWMKDKDKEVNTIKKLMKLMKNTEIASSENVLSDKALDSEKALVFVLTSLDHTEPFLSELEKYLKQPQSDRPDAPESKPWYSSEDVMDSVRRKVKLFSDFAEANEDRNKKSLRFLAVGLADENHEASTIYLYEDGFRKSKNFEIPSKPEAVTVSEVTESTVRLTFSAPSEGAQSITGYRVEFCEKGQEEWKQRAQAEAGEVTVSALSPNTEYSVRVRGVTAVGVGPAAAALTVTTAKGSHEADLQECVQETQMDDGPPACSELQPGGENLDEQSDEDPKLRRRMKSREYPQPFTDFMDLYQSHRDRLYEITSELEKIPSVEDIKERTKRGVVTGGVTGLAGAAVGLMAAPFTGGLSLALYGAGMAVAAGGVVAEVGFGVTGQKEIEETKMKRKSLTEEFVSKMESVTEKGEEMRRSCAELRQSQQNDAHRKEKLEELEENMQHLIPVTPFQKYGTDLRKNLFDLDKLCTQIELTF